MSAEIDITNSFTPLESRAGEVGGGEVAKMSSNLSPTCQPLVLIDNT